MIEAHSPLGGSTVKRWSQCPGSIRLSKDIPSQTSSYADEGTLAHEIAAHYLIHNDFPKDLPPDFDKIPILVYAETIQNDLKESEFAPILMIERKFDLGQVYPGLFGTADCVMYSKENKKLTVYDFKFGQGVAVEILDGDWPNLQLLYYALGAALIPEVEFQVDEVEIVIVQPRCPHPDGVVRRHTINQITLHKFANQLRKWAVETTAPNAPLKAGDHCKFCPAAPICPELHENAIKLAQTEFNRILPYDPETLGKILNWLPILSSWISSVREFAYRESQHGRVPPGWKLVTKRATRKWRDEQQALQTLLEVTGLQEEAFFEKTLKSPAQVEKLVGKKVIASLTKSEPTGNTLAPLTDKREPVKPDFEVIK